MEEETPVSLASMNTETLDSNDIYNDAVPSSGVIHTPGIFDYNGAPSPIISPINLTPDTHINHKVMIAMVIMKTVIMKMRTMIMTMAQLRKYNHQSKTHQNQSQ